MKKSLLILALASSVCVAAQLQVNSLQLTANDLVYDAVTNRIYASIPSSNGANGNSLGIINPATTTLENTVFMGSEPTVLAISDNGQYIYSGFSGSSTVRQFNVNTQSAGMQFGLGSDSGTGPNYAEDIEVMPGQPNIIAVSRRNVGYSPKHEGVAIIENGIMRPVTTPDHTGSNRIEFTSANTLIGYNNESTEYGLRKMSVNASGVTVASVTQSVLNGFSLDFSYYNNRIYSTNGQVADISGTPFVIGQFQNVSGPSVFDAHANRVAYVNFDNSGGNIIFKRFNPDTFLLADSLPIPQSFGTVKSIITCGSGCYAFNTNSDKIYIIKDAALATSSVNRLAISVFPNPTSDFITIDAKETLKNVVLLDATGKIVRVFKNISSKIDVRSLGSGMYFLQITDRSGKTSTHKVIKK